MLQDLQPVQIFNAITNIMGIALFAPVVWWIGSRLKKLRDRYTKIESRLDQILLLTHELYQSEIKDKTTAQVKDLQDIGRPSPAQTTS